MTGIDFECALVYFACERCGGNGIDPVRIDHGPDYCSGCSGNGETVAYIGTWLSNLAIGAALCRAYNEGSFQTAAQFIDMLNTDEIIGRQVWSPGCQRPAPGEGREG